MRAHAPRIPRGGTFHIEDVQDQVELAPDARAASTRSRAPTCCTARSARASAPSACRKRPSRQTPRIHVIDGGAQVPLDTDELEALIDSACEHLHAGADVDPSTILAATLRNLYDGVPIDEVHKARSSPPAR